MNAKFTFFTNVVFQAAAIAAHVANLLITNPSITPDEHKVFSVILMVAQGLLGLKAHFHTPDGDKIEKTPTP